MRNLVFIHGTGDDHRAWQKQREFFAGSHAVLDVDLPRRGRRAEEQPLDSREDNAREVLLRMDAAGMPQAVLIGHSAGGAVAMMIALQSPNRVLALVLVATGARLDVGPGVPPQRVRRLAELTIMAPTLVISGSDDRLVPRPLVESLAASIPGAQLVILPACGHDPQVEQEAAFNVTLVKFLGHRLTRGGPPIVAGLRAAGFTQRVAVN